MAVTTKPQVDPPAESPSHTARRAGAGRRGLEEAGELVSFSGRVIVALGRTPLYASEVLRQTGLLVKGTTPFLVIMQIFFGFTLVNYAFFFFRTIGASDYIGVVTGILGVRLGCIEIFGYVFASKVACGMVAELGAAKINEEIDAYETEGVDPYTYMVATRVMAALIYIPIAAIVGLAALTLGAELNAVQVLQGLNAEQLLSVHWASISLNDVVYLVVINGVTGFAMVMVGCFYGMRASGGPAAVGDAVARSLIVNLTLAHVIPAFLAMMLYNVQSPDLFIGG